MATKKHMNYDSDEAMTLRGSKIPKAIMAPRALASIVPRMLPSFSPVNSTTSRLSPTTSSTPN